MGFEAHCESYIASGATWDLAQALVQSHGQSGWGEMEALWYHTLTPTGAAYRIAQGGTCNTAAVVDGCGQANWYTVFLSADDDDGNLSNGTPNGCRIWDAFDAHGIACGIRPACTGGGGGSGLTLTALPVPGGWDQVQLKWTIDEEDIEGFRLQRQKPPAGWETIHTFGPEEREYTDVVPEIPDAGGPMYYFYRIFADYEGTAIESNRAEGKMYGDAPATPDNLRPRGCIDMIDPTLSWHGGQSTSFNAYLVNTQTTQDWWWQTTEPFSPVPEPLVAGTAYVLKVIGQNNIGNGSTSNPEYFVPFCAPTAPPRIASPFGCTPSLAPQVSWTPGSSAQPVLWYHLVVNRVVDIDHDPEVIPGGVDVPGNQTSWTFPPGLLAAGQEYRVKLYAFTGVAGPYSEMAFFTPQCNPNGAPGTASPIAPAGTVPTSQPTYTWRPASQATSHKVEVYRTNWQTALTQTFPVSGTCDGSTCSARPSQALLDGPYYWRTLGANAYGSALYGPWGSFTVANQNPHLTVADVSVTEGSGAAQFVLHLDHAPATSVTVQVTTSDGSAQAPSDYTTVSGQYTVPMGQTDYVVSVPIVADAVLEPNETFGLTVSNALGAEITDGQAIATIVNDDAPPRFVAGTSVYAEAGPKGGSWMVPVRLEGASQADVTVSYAFGSCTADPGVDFAPASGVVTFHLGETQKLVPLTVFDDQAPEGHETVALQLTNPVGGVIGTSPGPTTIVNDDPPGLVSLRSDFDGDGNNDVVWRDEATGALFLWRMVGVNKIATLPFDPPAPATSGWTLVGTADFDGNGRPDLLWRNATSGRLSFWMMNGVVRTSGQLVDGETDLAWKVVATGRFGGSSSPDLLWRHDTTGDLKVWHMQGTVKQSETLLSPSHPVDANWAFQGAGDFDADGQDDVLWRNTVSGNLVAWLLDGTVRREARFLSPLTLPGWQVAALLDVDSNGTTDVLWQRSGPQQVGAWLMQGTTQKCSMLANPSAPDSDGWRVVGPR
jgi:hypothetical protein